MRLNPKIHAALARDLLDRHEAVQSVASAIGEYGEQLLRQMMTVPDDQLAGYRGMLLALDSLNAALQREALQRAAERT